MHLERSLSCTLKHNDALKASPSLWFDERAERKGNNSLNAAQHDAGGCHSHQLNQRICIDKSAAIIVLRKVPAVIFFRTSQLYHETRGGGSLLLRSDNC